MSSGNVLERSVLQPGKPFIREGEDNTRAYVVQTGEIRGYTMKEGSKVEVIRFGPGAIIGEINLMIDEASTMSYEAMETTTVVTITRQDFQKKLARADKSITTILDYAVKKISKLESEKRDSAIKNFEIDPIADALVKGLIAPVSDDKKDDYKNAILPHINGLLKDLKSLKAAAKKEAAQNSTQDE